MSVETRKKLRQSKIQGRVSSIQTKNAQQKLDLLENIDSKSLSERNKKIRNAHIARQKDIIKGLKPPTLASSAAKFGLKSIPVVGTFLSIVSSKPAGVDSDIMPGQKTKKDGTLYYKSGGKVAKKHR
jgi:hypothetical protein